MKTRIIQDEPEPTRRRPPSQRSNIAGRMARWSAHHRKKAIFGWLAFVVLSVAIGAFVGSVLAVVWRWILGV